MKIRGPWFVGSHHCKPEREDEIKGWWHHSKQSALDHRKNCSRGTGYSVIFYIDPPRIDPKKVGWN